MRRGSVMERVAGAAGHLTPAERRVARFFVDAGTRAAALSAQEIAGELGTSDATVVRTAKALGYDGLRDLRRALATADSEPTLTERLERTLAGSGEPPRILEGAVREALSNLEGLLARITEGDLVAAVDILARASRIVWYGNGPSAHLADYAALLARRMGRPSRSLTRSGADHADELLELTATDAVVLLAYGRVHSHVRVLLQRAAEVGAPVVLVTDTLGTRLAGSVSVTLTAGRGTPGLFASHGTTIVVVETLILAVAATDLPRAETSLSALNDLRAALAGRRIDVDPR